MVRAFDCQSDKSGCCFTECERNMITHCRNQTSPHSFCMDCAKQYAETEIGNGRLYSPKQSVLTKRTILKCMDQSDCKEIFLESEIRRFLDEKTYEGFCKLRIQNELSEVDPFQRVL